MSNSDTIQISAFSLQSHFTSLAGRRVVHRHVVRRCMCTTNSSSWCFRSTHDHLARLPLISYIYHAKDPCSHHWTYLAAQREPMCIVHNIPITVTHRTGLVVPYVWLLHGMYTGSKQTGQACCTRIAHPTAYRLRHWRPGPSAPEAEETWSFDDEPGSVIS